MHFITLLWQLEKNNSRECSRHHVCFDFDSPLMLVGRIQTVAPNHRPVVKLVHDLLHRKAQIYKFSNKNDLFCAWKDFNKTFYGISTYHK